LKSSAPSPLLQKLQTLSFGNWLAYAAECRYFSPFSFASPAFAGFAFFAIGLKHRFSIREVLPIIKIRQSFDKGHPTEGLFFRQKSNKTGIFVPVFSPLFRCLRLKLPKRGSR